MPFDDPDCFRLDRVPVRSVRWLWRPYLACGKLALLDGDPGAGKSLSPPTWPPASSAADGRPTVPGAARRPTFSSSTPRTVSTTPLGRASTPPAPTSTASFVWAASGWRTQRRRCVVPCLLRGAAAHRRRPSNRTRRHRSHDGVFPAGGDDQQRSGDAQSPWRRWPPLAARSGASVLLVRQLTKQGGRKGSTAASAPSASSASFAPPSSLAGIRARRTDAFWP